MQPSVVELFKEYQGLVEKRAELKVYLKDLEAIEERMKEINKNLKEIDKFVSDMNQPITFANPILTILGIDPKKDQYSKNFTVFQKAVYVITSSRKALTTREMVDAIKKLENRINDDDYDTKLLGNLSSAVGSKANSGNTLRRYRYGGDWKYGLLEWFDSNGVIKIEYME